jgi:membrane protease YdiL (CAAX protease family)
VSTLYIAAVALTLLLVSFVGYGTYRAAQLLPQWPLDQNPLLHPVETGVRLLLIVICIGLGFLGGQSWAALGWQARQPLAQSVWGILWGLVLAAIYILTTRWVMAKSGDRYYAPTVVRVIVPRSPMQLLAVALAMVTVVALEELLFRSLLLGSLTPLAPSWFLLAAGGVIFGLMHSPQGWWGMVAIAVGGVALGLMFLWTQSLLMPIVAHYVVNMAQIVYAYGRGLPEAQEQSAGS